MIFKELEVGQLFEHKRYGLMRKLLERETQVRNKENNTKTTIKINSLKVSDGNIYLINDSEEISLP